MFTKLLALSVAGPNGQIEVTAKGVPSGGLIELARAIGVAFDLLFIAAILLCLFVIIWGGFSWMTSGGDKQKLSQARQKIVFAVIGLIVVFLAIFIVNLIWTLFGSPGAATIKTINLLAWIGNIFPFIVPFLP